MYSQYCIEDLSLVSRIEPRMDMMQIPNSIMDKAESEGRKVFCVSTLIKKLVLVRYVHIQSLPNSRQIYPTIKHHSSPMQCIDLSYSNRRRMMESIINLNR